MLLYKRTPPDQLALYDTIPMLVDIRSIFTVTPVNCAVLDEDAVLAVLDVFNEPVVQEPLEIDDL